MECGCHGCSGRSFKPDKKTVHQFKLSFFPPKNSSLLFPVEFDGRRALIIAREINSKANYHRR